MTKFINNNKNEDLCVIYTLKSMKVLEMAVVVKFNKTSGFKVFYITVYNDMVK